MKVGKRIQRARRAARYKNAKAFADAIGISATSVARAEAGWDTTGASVYADIERGLKWPEEIIQRYLATGDDSLLGRMTAEGDEPDDSAWVPMLTDGQIIAMDGGAVLRHYVKLELAFDAAVAEDWLFHAVVIRRNARIAERETLTADGQ